jgi:hypothetical protein
VLIPWARITLGLGVLLALSAVGNVWQLRRAWRASAVADAAAMQQTLDQARQIAASQQAAQAASLRQLDALVERGRQTRVIYRQAAATPLPEDCTPGQARVDAVNAGLGPSP